MIMRLTSFKVIIMFGEYSFELRWNELDEELRKDKIYHYRKFNKIADKEDDKEEGMSDDEIEEILEAHFPIYF